MGRGLHQVIGLIGHGALVKFIPARHSIMSLNLDLCLNMPVDFLSVFIDKVMPAHVFKALIY
jgi:hypothetical protein